MTITYALKIEQIINASASIINLFSLRILNPIKIDIERNNPNTTLNAAIMAANSAIMFTPTSQVKCFTE